MSLVSIFWVIWRKVMYICEEPGFWRLHKNMNCAFPLRRWYTVKLIWSNLLNQINLKYTSKFDAFLFDQISYQVLKK